MKESFLIDGPAGALELLTSTAKEQSKGVAVICHPHPQFEGTMHNKVVHTLDRAFHHSHLNTVRFNFRGVGKSEGEFGHSQGEVEDLVAVLDWTNAEFKNPPLVLAGFSFGAYIAAKGAALGECRQLFSIAPAVNHQPYNSLSGIDCPWVVIQGETDEVIPPQEVYQWFEKQKNRQQNMSLITIPNCSHFFHGHLVQLRTLVEENLLSL